ncbi:MAG: CvpA family protein [Bacillaceae bacterium]
MLDLVIIILFVIAFLIGVRRGFILGIVRLVSYIVAFLVASAFYDKLTPTLELWIPYPILGDMGALQSVLNLEGAFYNGISFIIIFFATKLGLSLLASMLDFLFQLPVLKQVNRWAGGALGFLEMYLVLFILLSIAMLLPIQDLQTSLHNAFLPTLIVEHTPIIAAQLKDLWLSA